MNHSNKTIGTLLVLSAALGLGGSALAGTTGGGQPQPPATPAITRPAVVAPTPVTPAAPAPATPTAPAMPATPTPPAEATLVTQAEGISEYRLSNGLTVLLFPDPSAGTFTLNVTYLVGSMHENYGETGMAHLLEHMVFKGTEVRGNIIDELGKRGAKFNGTTSFDRTNYFETLTNAGDNLEWAIAMEADRMVNSRVSAEDLSSEMTVVRNEFEMGENNPFGLLSKEVRSVAYDWHNYSNAPIGNRSDVENVPVERLQAFYRKYYQPDNAVVTLAGNFDPERALQLIQREFGVIPKPARTLAPLYTYEPTQNGERSVNVRRVGDQQILMVAYHVPSVRSEDMAALNVLTQVLNTEPAGRLHKALVQTGQARATGVFPGTGTAPGLLNVIAILDKADDLGEAEHTLLETLERTAEQPFTEEEVNRAKQALASSYQQLMADPTNLGLALSESIAAGDWRLLFDERNKIASVTPGDVQRVAEKYLRRSNRTLGRFIPTPQPDRVSIAQAPSAAEVLADFVAGEGLSAGEQLDTAPEALETRVIRETVDVGGTPVALAMLPKKTRADRVELRLALDFGNPDTIREGSDAADFIPMLLTRGSKDLSRQELTDRLEAINSTLDVSGGAAGLTLVLGTERQHLPEALELLRRVLREPTFPEEEFTEVQNLTLTNIEGSRNDPNSVASQRLARIFMPQGAERGDIEYVPTLDESLEDVRDVTRADIVKYYRDVVGVGRAQMSVVGDFDPATIRAAVPELLAGFESPVPYRRFVPTLTMPQGQSEVVEVPDKANAVYLAAQNFAMRDDNPDKAALDIAMQIFGAGTDSRLFNRLRQQGGLSYHAGANAYQSSRDEQGGLYATAIYNPGVREKVAGAMQEEFRRIAAEGFSDEEVNDARRALLEEYRATYAADSALAGALLSQADLGRTFAFQAEWEERLNKVTPESAQAAFLKYIHPDDLVIIQSGTFNK